MNRLFVLYNRCLPVTGSVMSIGHVFSADSLVMSIISACKTLRNSIILLHNYEYITGGY